MMYCKNPYSELQQEAHEPEFVRRVMIQGKIAERYSATKFFLFVSFYRVLVFVLYESKCCHYELFQSAVTNDEKCTSYRCVIGFIDNIKLYIVTSEENSVAMVDITGLLEYCRSDSKD